MTGALTQIIFSLIFSLAIRVAFGYATWTVVKKKGYPSFGWFFLGLIGIIIGACLTDKCVSPQVMNGYPIMQQPMYQGWTCPFCGQMNPSNAMMCACGTPMPMNQPNNYQATQYQAPQSDPNATPYENQMSWNQQNNINSTGI